MAGRDKSNEKAKETKRRQFLEGKVKLNERYKVEREMHCISTDQNRTSSQVSLILKASLFIFSTRKFSECLHAVHNILLEE